jgi:hypothetical protein
MAGLTGVKVFTRWQEGKSQLLASLLIEQGNNIKYIQSQLGHTNSAVTLNLYAHLMKTVNHEAALRLKNLVFERNGHNLITTKEKGVTASAVTP